MFCILQEFTTIDFPRSISLIYQYHSLKLFKRIRLKIDSLKLYSLKPLIPSLLESQINFFRLSRPSPTLKPIKPRFHSLEPIRFEIYLKSCLKFKPPLTLLEMKNLLN